MTNTICLNMIVKNESKIITRLFDSVVNIIDCYCICDTGSTDNTIDLIKNYFKKKNIPGEVFTEKFKNFGFNRTRALELAKNKGTYLLLLDADMILHVSDKFNKDKLDKDVYTLIQKTTNLNYFNTRLIKSNIGIKCLGSTHEYYNIPNGMTKGDLKSLYIEDVGDGGSKQDKFKRDINLLENDIMENKKQKHNDFSESRAYFYLSNSYYNNNNLLKAEENYKKTIELDDWIEEVWFSYYRLGLIYIKQKKPDKAISVWLKGYNKYPVRSENIYEICKHYRITSNYNLAFLFYKIGKQIPYPDNSRLFIQKNVYDYLFDYELSIIAYYINKKKEAANISLTLLNNKNNSHLNNVLENYKFYSPKLKDNSKFNEINISTRLNENFVSSTPSIIFHNNKFLVNLRYVNYKLTKDGVYERKHQIITINEYREYSMNFEKIKSKFFVNKKSDEIYVGIEDVRLFELNNKIYYSGTGYKDNTIGVSIEKYDIRKKQIIEHVYPSPFDNNVEKNWVLFNNNNELSVIYSWYPLIIGKVGNNQFIETHNIETPYLFKNLRGSTNGLTMPNNEIWFICHLVSHEKKRYYYHIIVILDAHTLKVKKYSKIFTFRNNCVEYCCGFTKTNDKFIFSYSEMDNSSYIGSIPISEINELF